MHRSAVSAWRLVGFLAAASLSAGACFAAGDGPADSALVKLLKSGRVPEERLGAIIEMVGKRGGQADLNYLYDRVVDPKGFSTAIRVKAMSALAEAAINRNSRPAGSLEKLVQLIPIAGSLKGPESAVGREAVRLAGLWKLKSAADRLTELARKPGADRVTQTIVLESLVGLGDRGRLDDLSRDPDLVVGLPATAALASLDLPRAAARAAEILPAAAAARQDVDPLIAAFLHHKGGSDELASAIAMHSPPADAARLALRAVYAHGHSDPLLVSALGKAAGIAADVKPPSPEELVAWVALVAKKGDPVRGEAVFRRVDLNCFNCHSLAKAGGEVGPDLSAIGMSSPVDYVIRSILVPDESIKEQFHTLVVLTSDGQVFQGIVVDKDDQRIVLKEASGQTRSVPVSSIEDQKEGGSLMPKGLANLMTRGEFLDLVRFLSELGKPGPYAIRTTPTFQRYRVLRPIPGDDAVEFRTRVMDAPAEHWSSVYARVDGSLPLDEIKAPDGKTLYLQAEIDASAAGPVELVLDSAAGVTLWAHDEPVALTGTSASLSLSPGREKVTFAIDPGKRDSRVLRVEIKKPAGSAAEFTVVGGP